MRKEIRTGLFAIIVIAAALVAVEFLRGKDIFSRNNTYYIIYGNVEGLEVSTPVTVGGFQAGRISDIEYNPRTLDYTVTVSISPEFSIPSDSRMTVYSADILGTKKIKVTAGTSPVPASPGDTLPGGSESDLLSSAAGSIQPVAAGLDSLITALNQAVGSINLILDSDNRARIDDILASLSTSADNISAITSEVSCSDISGIIARISSITASLDSAAAAATKTVTNAEEITASLRDAQPGATVDSIRIMIGRLQDPSGSIGKLIYSDSLYNSLTRLSNDLDSLVRGIRADPKKYIKISVF